MSRHIVDDEQRRDHRATPMHPLGSGLARTSAALALLDDVHRHRLRRAALHIPPPNQERALFYYSDRLLDFNEYGIVAAGMAINNLIGANLEEIEAVVASLNESRYRARQIYTGIYKRLYSSWDKFADLGKKLREKLKEQYSISHLPVQRVFISNDGTRRYLYEVGPGQRIESVFIPEERRDTFCISTQVGCAIGCLFCATGRLPMQRNLLPGEIVGQILTMQAERGTSSRRLNIVIMGMGEPFYNYENVTKAFRLMIDDQGMSISPRRITLSTSGIVPGIRRFAEEPVIPNLAISLNATTDKVRDLLMPINKKWNIEALLEACRSFPLAQRRRITFEYVLIEDINDSLEDAHRLVSLLRGLRKKVNLIPLNTDSWIPLKTSPPTRVLAFQEILARHHITVNIRRPRGDDVSAACGMLAGRLQHQSDFLHAPPTKKGQRDKGIKR